MATAQQFYNEVLVDVLNTAFYGEGSLPIINTYFPRTPLISQVLEDADGNRGQQTGTIDWELEIEVLLVGDKYLRYSEELGLSPSVTVTIFVQSEVTVSYYFNSGSYYEPPDEDVDIDDFENSFNPQVEIEGETVEFSEETARFFEKFSKDHANETDEDLEYLVHENKKKQLLGRLLISQGK